VFSLVAKNVKKYFKYIQIWLNYVMDDRQFSYITKNEKKKLEDSLIPSLQLVETRVTAGNH
jgi:hypothetical protein